jgi:hypothetical protein
MSFVANQAVQTRQCAFCGKRISVTLNQCPFCREMVPHVRLSSRVSNPDAGQKIRRGLLYMLLAGVFHYFAAGYGAPLKFPVEVAPIVTSYLSPLLFLGGLGLTVYGLFLRARS